MRKWLLLVVCSVLLSGCEAPSDLYKASGNVEKISEYPRIFRYVDEQYHNVCYITYSYAIDCVESE
jgi:hypothetical protein